MQCLSLFQNEKFDDLKSSIDYMILQINELRGENNCLRNDLDTIKDRAIIHKSNKKFKG